MALIEACCIDDTLQAPNADETLLDPQSKLALVLDHDTRMRSFVAQMEACERLNDQGVAGAGRLASMSHATYAQPMNLSRNDCTFVQSTCMSWISCNVTSLSWPHSTNAMYVCLHTNSRRTSSPTFL